MLKSLLKQPLFLYPVSFPLMAVFARPQYRLRPGQSVSLIQYWADSVLDASAMPGITHPKIGRMLCLFGVGLMCVSSLSPGLRAVAIAYLILLWGLYVLGWGLWHSGVTY